MELTRKGYETYRQQVTVSPGVNLQMRIEMQIEQGTVEILECTGEICMASGTFTSDMHWTADKLYILRSGVFIGNGEDETTLVIDPGTEIHGERLVLRN